MFRTPSMGPDMISSPLTKCNSSDQIKETYGYLPLGDRDRQAEACWPPVLMTGVRTERRSRQPMFHS